MNINPYPTGKSSEHVVRVIKLHIGKGGLTLGLGIIATVAFSCQKSIPVTLGILFQGIGLALFGLYTHNHFTKTRLKKNLVS